MILKFLNLRMMEHNFLVVNFLIKDEYENVEPNIAVNLAEFAYESLTGKLDVPIVLAKQFLFNSKSSLKGLLEPVWSMF